MSDYSPLVEAMMDYVEGDTSHPLVLHNSYGEPEEMSVEVFFREEEDLTDLEQLAIKNCQGHVLDLGAGAGALSLILQTQNQKVTALENDPGCVQLMNALGVENTVEGDFWAFEGQFDTVLVMMNGLGLAGTLENASQFLKKCMNLLKPGGQLLFDSSDISYLYAGEAEQKTFNYYGEVRYQYEYKGSAGNCFHWVYIDQETFKKTCEALGLKLEVLFTDEYEQYLGRIQKK